VPTLAPVPEATSATAPDADADPDDQVSSGPTSEIDFAAAEAEALSFDGDLDGETDEEPAESDGGPSTTTNDDPESTTTAELPAFDPTPGAQVTTKVAVAGLVSVASIANFKRSLGRVSGVWSIGVSSGPGGEFVFTVNHDIGLSLPREIEAMSAFESQITGESDGEIQVSARDRDTVD
jgi:hypothetical protein